MSLKNLIKDLIMLEQYSMTPSPSGKQEFSMKDSPVVDTLKGVALRKLNNIGMTVRSPNTKLKDFQKAYDAIDDVESDIGALGSIKFMGEPPGMKLDKDTAKHSGTVAKAVSAGKPPPPLPKSDVATAPTIPQKKAIPAIPPNAVANPASNPTKHMGTSELGATKSSETQQMAVSQTPEEIRSAARVTPSPPPFGVSGRVPRAAPTQRMSQQALNYAQSKSTPTGTFDPNLGRDRVNESANLKDVLKRVILGGE
ncbi:MAG: hypothetical protein E6R04_07680 [Spirochaetes bacterium]|nr:MAG: hypothetical protein E6R04_07680 [Spirochaetota bacterium]